MLNTNKQHFIQARREDTRESRILRTQDVIKYLRDVRTPVTHDQLTSKFNTLPLEELGQHRSVIIQGDYFIYRPLLQIHFEKHIDRREQLEEFLESHPNGVPAYILADSYATAAKDVQELIDEGKVLYMEHHIDGQDDRRVLYPVSLINDDLVPSPVPPKILELWDEVELPPTDAAIESLLAQRGYEVLTKVAAVREKKRAIEKKQTSVFSRPGRTKLTNRHMLAKFNEQSFK